MRFWFAIGLLIAACQTVWAEELRLGYLALDEDPRFDEKHAYARISLNPQGDSSEAFGMALNDMKTLTDVREISVVPDIRRVSQDALLSNALEMVEGGVRYLILDLPAEEVDALAGGLAQSPVTLFNATAPDGWLRRRCHPGLLHTAASDRMISDAIVQHLVRQDWTNVLVLLGKTRRDEYRAAAFEEAAKRLRLRIVDTRVFDLSTSPEKREENNVMLLTGGTRDYDAIFVADEFGEFSRYVPYRTARARPVFGANGLTALEWHWSLERYGAPQVNSRFEALSGGGRRMGWQDWSVWIATSAALTAEVKSRDRSPEGTAAFLRSHRLRLDGSKGVSMSFRPWNGQLRMPVLLATHNAIIDIAPIGGFEHKDNVLDSLGQDEAEFACD